jgi:hypothetical protein
MNAARTSTIITTFSALVLAAGGVALLFGSDELLPRLIPRTPVSDTVLGQLVAAGWLAVAWLNWTQRRGIIGGIYGRPTVLANLALYLISAFSLARPAMTGSASLPLQAVTLLLGVMAVIYAVLLKRGPFADGARAVG